MKVLLILKKQHEKYILTKGFFLRKPSDYEKIESDFHREIEEWFIESARLKNQDVNPADFAIDKLKQEI